MNLDERARRATATIRGEAARVDTDALLTRIEATGRGRRRRLTAAAVLVGAAVLVAVVALVLPSLPDGLEIGPDPAGRDGSQPPASDPTSGESPAPSETSSTSSVGGEWQRVRPGGSTGAADDRLRAVAASGGLGTVAVGRHADGPGIWWHGPTRRPEEPSAWERVGTELCGAASCELEDVAVTRDRFVVVGMLDGLPAAWWSADGRTWARAEMSRSSAEGPTGATHLTAVAAGPQGLVAFGSEDGGSRPIVFTSTDGESWSEAAVDFDQEEAGAHVVAAVAVGDDVEGGVVAIGYVGDGSVLWQERDGAWGARHLSEDDPGFGDVTTAVTSLHTDAGDRWLMTGSARGAQDEDGRVWSSSDGGATWQAMAGDLGGPGDQQVTDLFMAGGSLVAVGRTSDDPDGDDHRPAAWMLEENGWRPVDGGAAFAEAGAIEMAVATDGHGAVAVGAAAGAAIWTYAADRAGGEATTGATCSAEATADPLAPQPDLPAPVADVRRAIHDAATACDLDTLAALAAEGTHSFTYSFGEGGDPAAYWRRGEAEGDEPLLALATILSLPHTTIETQFVADEYETVHVWPSAFAEDATDADWEAVVESGLLTEQEARRMRDELGGYLGYRVGITEDGEWVFFVAGD